MSSDQAAPVGDLNAQRIAEQPTVFGHPAGLYTLFFAEMWERFSYYGMRALLVFYMIKGFLGYDDTQAYSVYGFYTSLVYMTPFIGGMLADKILGRRIAVVIGGVLMAAGHLLMTMENQLSFFFALSLLIIGNGFFKPNISTMVGSLYAPGDKKRDDGFNIFYTGINLGAAMSPLLCGFIGERYGWHWGFGLATGGMMVGLAVFVMPTLLTSALIMLAAIASTIGLVWFHTDNIWATAINVFVAVCLMIAAVAACRALSKGGLPSWAGGRPEGMDGRHDWKIYAGIVVLLPVFAALVSGFSPWLEVSEKDQEKVAKKNATRMEDRIEFLEGLGVQQDVIDKVEAAGLTGEYKARAKPFQLISKGTIEIVKGKSATRLDDILVEATGKEEIGSDFKFVDLTETQRSAVLADLNETFNAEFEPSVLEENGTKKDLEKYLDSTLAGGLLASFAANIAGTFLEEVSKPAGLVLTILGVLAFGYLIVKTFQLTKVARERMLAALVLIFFQMLFFAFFEQAGSSINNFTDRNIDRVGESRVIAESDVNSTLTIQPTQAQLGYERDGKVFTLDDLTRIRKIQQEVEGVDAIEIQWPVTDSNVTMGIAEEKDELPATIFQSFNAMYILIFALIFNWIWAKLRARNMDPSAPVKFGLGLAQLGLGFLAFWVGAQFNTMGMVSIFWLALGYLLHTTGELCLSPVGLSTMTKLSPKALVSTLMGAWFLATAFSQYLAAVISQFTSIEGGSGDGFPPPSETVTVYADVFLRVGAVAILSGLLCLVLSPLLTKWMHQDKMGTEADA